MIDLTAQERHTAQLAHPSDFQEYRNRIGGFPLLVAQRISRLQRSGVVPRETAALMRTITDMRNAAEYQDKTLSAAENRVVWAAWEPLQEWAAERS